MNKKLLKAKWNLIINTVKLGFNDRGYNEFTVITNNFILLVWFGIYFQQNFILLTNNKFSFHGYNEQIFNFLALFCRKCYDIHFLIYLIYLWLHVCYLIQKNLELFNSTLKKGLK